MVYSIRLKEHTARFFVPIKVSFKSGVRKNLLKFIGKHLCQSLLFDKVAGLLLKKRLWERCFSVSFAKLLRMLFFAEHLWATASVKFFINFYFNFIKKFSEIPQL